MQNREIIITADGSSSIFVPELNECFHSKFGAIAESKHIFINAGFNSISIDISNINILEIGFGTGLNTFLTYREAELKQKQINYTTIELYPLELDFITNLNYIQFINFKDSQEIFLRLHEAKWNVKVPVSDIFCLEKIQQNFINFVPENNQYHLIYFDAFGPDVQPELWTTSVFEKLAACLKPRGILVTYSTKGDVKRALKKAGFAIEKLPGPIGKREILRAVLM